MNAIEKLARKKADAEFAKMKWTEGDGTTRQAALYYKQIYLKWVKKLSIKK